MKILTQNVKTSEILAIAQACLMEGIQRRIVDIEDLERHADDLRSARAMPVGSVEFVRAAMRIAGVQEPADQSYPEVLQDLMLRNARLSDAGSILGTWFVKPAHQIKAFTGFVFDTFREREDYPEDQRESYDAFMALEPEQPVWMVDPVRFLSEWRYYFNGQTLLGHARYDDGPDHAPEPDMQTVIEAAHRLSRQAEDGADSRQTGEAGQDIPCNASRNPCAASFALDFGVLESGETALVEFTDAWAIGLYGKAMRPQTYLSFLQARWSELIQNQGQGQVQVQVHGQGQNPDSDREPSEHRPREIP